MERKVQQIHFIQPLQIKLLRVAAYARVSSGKDAMLRSLSAQVSYYNNLISGNREWSFCGVYADEAKTGTKDNRENFQKLIDRCRKGEIDMIITKSISRFARNTVTLLKIVRELKSIGVDVYFEEQNIHTMSSEGELMLTILASYAQEESRSASENQKWRIRKCFEQGELVNMRTMFGFEIIKGKMQPNKETAPIVAEIFKRVLDGESYGSIARDLNVRGIQGAFGGKWESYHIGHMIKNEKYIGDSLLQKQFRNNHLQKKLIANKGQLPKYYAENTHCALIDKATYNQVQQIADERKAKYGAKKPATLNVFSGLIQCSQCGCSYKRVTSNGTVGYNCSTYLRQGKTVCHGKKIPENVLKQLTMEVLGGGDFNEEVIATEVKKIIVPEPNHLYFYLSNGSEVEKIWKDRSRRESWTPEMKEKARQYSLAMHRRKKEWQEQ